MGRVKFKKGEQRKFLKKVLVELNCPSLRRLNQFGFDVPYSTLKNYYSEARLLPENFFRDLCYLSKTDYKKLDIIFLGDNWGKSVGGKTPRKRFK